VRIFRKPAANGGVDIHGVVKAKAEIGLLKRMLPKSDL
jgi:hypothetical protein